jgi:hypothetical protein
METGPSGDPLGITVNDGRLLSTPSKRVAFGWGPDKSELGFAAFAGTVQSGDHVVRIDGINQRCNENAVVLDTPDAGLALAKGPCLSIDIRFADPRWSPSTVLKGTIESVSADRESIRVEPGHAILEARGAARDQLAAFVPGAALTVVFKTTGFDWERIDTVIGGGPCLLREGTIKIDAVEEGLAAGFAEHKHPRTAIGRTKDDDLWLVAVDGRQETGDGMTLVELAQLMLSLGCVDAMNLDGGGSTTMNVLGVTVNRPSDGQERSIADAILIHGPALDRGESPLKLTVPKTMYPGAIARAVVTGANGPLPNARIIWACQGASAIDQGGTLWALKPGIAHVSASAEGQVLKADLTVQKSPQAGA